MRETVRYTYAKPKGTSSGAVFAHATTPEGNDVTVGSLAFLPPMAWVDVDEDAGTMISTSQARIVDAAVSSNLQGQGIGSEMYRVAQRELNAPLGHSASLSASGYRFAKSVGGDIPKSAQGGPTFAGYNPGPVIREVLKDHPYGRRMVPGAPKPPAQAMNSPQFKAVEDSSLSTSQREWQEGRIEPGPGQKSMF